jgi:lysophospholipase
MNSKFNAGFRATTVDAYGRAISYDFIGGTQGGNALTWSNVTTLSAFKSHEIPYPIITLTDTNVPQGECFPSPTNPIWEVGPYEFGSWDQDVNAFYPTEYLGTPAPTRWFFWQKSSCINGFDNAGLITGISSDTFVSGNTCARNGTVKPLAGLGQVVNDVFGGPNLESSPYGIVPNPFYHSKRAGKVNERQDLYMQDGGYTGQGIPIFPFIQPERQVDVIFGKISLLLQRQATPLTSISSHRCHLLCSYERNKRGLDIPHLCLCQFDWPYSHACDPNSRSICRAKSVVAGTILWLS